MKLSTAIRIGSLTTKQAFMCWNDGNNGYCALGSALSALNKRVLRNDEFTYSGSSNDFNCASARTQWLSYPIYLFCVVVRLNDIAFWDRQRIADWVEHIENRFGFGQQVSKKEELVHAAR